MCLGRGAVEQAAHVLRRQAVPEDGLHKSTHSLEVHPRRVGLGELHLHVAQQRVALLHALRLEVLVLLLARLRDGAVLGDGLVLTDDELVVPALALEGLLKLREDHHAHKKVVSLLRHDLRRARGGSVAAGDGSPLRVSTHDGGREAVLVELAGLLKLEELNVLPPGRRCVEVVAGGVHLLPLAQVHVLLDRRVVLHRAVLQDVRVGAAVVQLVVHGLHPQALLLQRDALVRGRLQDLVQLEHGRVLRHARLHHKLAHTLDLDGSGRGGGALRRRRVALKAPLHGVARRRLGAGGEGELVDVRRGAEVDDERLLVRVEPRRVRRVVQRVLGQARVVGGAVAVLGAARVRRRRLRRVDGLAVAPELDARERGAVGGVVGVALLDLVHLLDLLVGDAPRRVALPQVDVALVDGDEQHAQLRALARRGLAAQHVLGDGGGAGAVPGDHVLRDVLHGEVAAHLLLRSARLRLQVGVLHDTLLDEILGHHNRLVQVVHKLLDRHVAHAGVPEVVPVPVLQVRLHVLGTLDRVCAVLRPLDDVDELQLLADALGVSLVLGLQVELLARGQDLVQRRLRHRVDLGKVVRRLHEAVQRAHLEGGQRELLRLRLAQVEGLHNLLVLRVGFAARQRRQHHQEVLSFRRHGAVWRGLCNEVQIL
eukprot:Rhum_TRINITY_DN10742_c0_g2::Rhum_TRINITY_DN10742_c0_g2_i1::g.40126::m.40126